MTAGSALDGKHRFRWLNRTSVISSLMDSDMPKDIPSAVRAVLSSGMDMKEFGSANWALRRADALEAVSRLYELGVPILGGDVWEMRDGRPSLTRDNWFYRRLEDEPLVSFLERSTELAKRHIRNYGSNEDKEYLFELVPDVKFFSGQS